MTPHEAEAMTTLLETELDAGELISGMSVGVAQFDGEDLLRTTNDRFGALLPLLGPVVNRGIGFRDLMHRALLCGQFDLQGENRTAWLDRVLTVFDLGQGGAVELKRSDRRWLMLSCRMTALGHRICNLVDISSQKRLSEFITEFSSITGSRQIDATQRLERMLLLGCAYLNLPTAAVLRETGETIEMIAAASPSGKCDGSMVELYQRIGSDEKLTIESLDQNEPAGSLDSLVIGKRFRLDEGDAGCIVFAGDHWGDGPLDNTDRQLIHLLADWTGQELSRQSDQVELERAYEELRLAATTDFLTGCFNRRHFLEAAEASRNFHVRIGKSFAILLLDIDHFKQVNDRFGHSAGDDALCIFADIVRQALRDHDIVARYGGEEFAVFLYNSDAQGAALVAERIRLNVANAEITSGANRFAMTVSIGLCQVDVNDDLSVEAAIIRADEALYAAKGLGRNQLVCHNTEGKASSGPQCTDVEANAMVPT